MDHSVRWASRPGLDTHQGKGGVRGGDRVEGRTGVVKYRVGLGVGIGLRAGQGLG